MLWNRRLDRGSLPAAMVKVINIRRSDVTADLRELASLKGLSLTETLAQAVRAKLDELRALHPGDSDPPSDHGHDAK